MERPQHTCSKCGGTFESEVANFCPYCRAPLARNRPPGLPADLSNDDVKALFSMPDGDDTMHQQS